ncbi:hypothetical protein [Flavobacterium cerinum]|uniref:Uncharacterized protein n=1 Tax=Flavobacterium cerinum TaxID=2502784 RepID=A0A444GLM3_9FLAO|nr:hypothetical protein [Flavobacterium cerinum]RWW91873.1 hypothetical protein EPI11_17680 [Flavobacterium cerinum]
MATDINIIFGWFATGKEPTQEQFRQTFLSFYHKNETIPLAKVFKLIELLDAKAEKEQFDGHLIDPNAHQAEFEKLKNPCRFMTISVNEDIGQLQHDNLKNVEFNGIAFQNQFLTDGFTLDPETGILKGWEFEKDIKYLIYYTIQ